MTARNIQFITGNAGKLREVKAILCEYPDVAKHVNIDKMEVPDLVEIQEADFEKMLVFKANEAMKYTDKPVLLEDTWLCFDALGGLPGPYIKWFLDRVGREGLYKMLEGFEDKSATAVCIFAFCEGQGHKPKLFKGETRGRIVYPRGSNNFGWDPIFEPTTSSHDMAHKTYAELAPEQKNVISHRRKAVVQVIEYLREWISKQ